jgi:hypothetical protein
LTPEPFGSEFNQTRSSDLCLTRFSLREPKYTSLENATVASAAHALYHTLEIEQVDDQADLQG